MSKEQNPFTIWNDLNKQMLDAWTDWAGKAVPLPKGSEATAENPYAAYYDFFAKSFSQNPFLSGTQTPGLDFVDQMYKTWIDGVQNMSTFIPNQSVKESFDRFMNAFTAFNGLQSYWNTYLKNVPTEMKDWESFSKNAMQQYQNIAKSFSVSFAPEQLKSVLTLPMEGFGTIQQTIAQLFKPWVDGSSELQ